MWHSGATQRCMAAELQHKLKVNLKDSSEGKCFQWENHWVRDLLITLDGGMARSIVLHWLVGGCWYFFGGCSKA